MTVDPASTEHPATQPPTAAAHLNLAERYASYAEYAASTASTPRTVASSLDVARFHAFTGELTFASSPVVRLYLDGGTVYHAERDGDPPISRRLLDAGVIDSMQLERGVVRVGDVDHLGRLFDRDQSIDRDAVMVIVESSTAAILQQIADSVIASVSVSAYRHHPSGIHRWFVAPIEPARAQRPSSGVVQVDRSVIEELPHLGTAADSLDARDIDPADAMDIEWADPDLVADGEEPASANTATTDLDVDAELERLDAERADWAATFGGVESDTSAESATSPVGEFQIVWPDGTREAPVAMPFDLESATTESDASTPDGPAATDQPTAPAPEPTAAEPPAAETPDATAPADSTAPATPLAPPESSPRPLPDPVGFATEPLRIEQLPAPDATVPEDVAAAVRRALRAIGAEASRNEGASPRDPHRAPVELPEVASPGLAPPGAPGPDATQAPSPVGEPVQPAPAEPVGFAPPTPDMRAEVIQQQAALINVDDDEAAPVLIEPHLPEPSSDAPAPETTETTRGRRGALRRLIDSLRKPD